MGTDEIKFLHRNNPQGSFRDRELIDWHLVREKYLAMEGISRERVIGTGPVPNLRESCRRQIVADLLVNLPDDAVEEALVAFPAPPKQADLSRIANVRQVITELQEQTAIRVEQDGRGALSQSWSICLSHGSRIGVRLGQDGPLP